MPDLALDSRSGLPDELAYLRPLYARNGWRTHSNFGDLANFWLHVHDSLRREGNNLRQATADFREGRLGPNEYRRTFAPGLERFLGHLNGHHQIEDRVYFPRFRALDARMAAGFDLLDSDHQQIHGALLESAQGANRFLTAFDQGSETVARQGEAYAAGADRLLSLLFRHLADEEDLIIPAMLHHGERQVG